MTKGQNITCHIRNMTGNNLTLHSHTKEHGKFLKLPSIIYNRDEVDEDGEVKASGASWSLRGTTGSFTYQAFDKTLFEITFKIKWGVGDNEIYNETKSDGGQGTPSNFTFKRTNSEYEGEETGSDPGASPVTVYFLIEKRSIDFK